MYNGIGLTSVRGSGTNGYVQKNMAHVSRARTARAKSVDKPLDGPGGSNPLRAPHRANSDILEHNRKRNVELQCLQLQEKLESQNLPDDVVERRVSELRESLMAKLPKPGDGPSGGSSAGDGGAGGRVGETHADAAAKEAESAALKTALGIKSDYVVGQAFDRELQQKLKEERMAKREAEEQARLQAEQELEREREREEKLARKEARREEKEARRRRRKEGDDSR